MNKRVLKTLIFLCWGFLIAFALLKTIWAEQFAIAISNPKIIEIGRFIDTHIWLKIIVHCITSLLVYQFYLCACCRVWHLSAKQYAVLIPIIIILTILNWYFPMIMLNFNYVVMFAIPFFLKADYKDVVIIFSAHVIGQVLISLIRSQPINLMDVNIMTQLICTFDMYVWLLLYYLYSNIYKESIIMGSLAPPVWGKMSKQVEQEIAKIDKKLATETNPDKIEKLKAKKSEYEKMLETDTTK